MPFERLGNVLWREEGVAVSFVSLPVGRYSFVEGVSVTSRCCLLKCWIVPDVTLVAWGYIDAFVSSRGGIYNERIDRCLLTKIIAY